MPAPNRVPPFVFAAMFACSLLPTITITALWIRSHFTGDTINRELIANNPDSNKRHNWAFFADCGYVLVNYVHEEQTYLQSKYPTPQAVSVWTYRRVKLDGKRYNGNAPKLLRQIGIRWQWNSQDYPNINGAHYVDTGGYIQVEDWTLLILSLLANALFFHLYRRRTLPERRAKQGLCPACGYDLRQTPNRCPECGNTPPSRQFAHATLETHSR